MKETILKYNAQVPRYTSYPTAPHFKDMDQSAYVSSLSCLSPEKSISLYLHIPFCQEMCWYCGCHTTATRKYAPVEDYVSLLLREIKIVAEKIGKKQNVAHVHFGGGSPTMLSPDDFRRIMEALRTSFNFNTDVEIAIEADPRGVTHDKVEAYQQCGVNRASFGLQDFAPEVQSAINRIQSFATVEKAISLFRQFGINRINFDLMYGLPKQTLAHIEDSVQKSMSLMPNRIALFGYAHVPWMKKHMRLIKDEDLPDALARIDQFSFAEQLLTTARMIPVGLDHFVTHDDDMLESLHKRDLTRNFQGYTTDKAETLIGFGMSSISRTADGFFQNAPNITEYSAAVLDLDIPTFRGYLVDNDDRLRADIISDLMCYLDVDLESILRRHSCSPNFFDDIIASLHDMKDDGLVRINGRHISVHSAARQAVRVVAARFDKHFLLQQKRHAQVA